MPDIRGSEWVLVGPLAFKACVGRLSASGVGSIPTRSRHSWGGTAGSHGSGGPPHSRLRLRASIGTAIGVAAILVTGRAGAIGAGDPASPAEPSVLRIEAPAGSAAPDTVAAAGEVPDSTLATRGGLDSPTAVMARSLVFPGWGQAKNRSWLKAIVVAGVEGAFLERIAYENRMADRYAALADAYAADDPLRVPFDQGVERHRNHRRDFVWWTGLWVFLAMGDAYTDAHLKHFDVRLQEDPPSGDRGDAAPGAAGSLRVQIGLVAHW